MRLRYLEHDPGRSILVQIAVDDRLAAVSIGRVGVGAEPVVAWYPDDPGLPGARLGWAVLAAALDLPGGTPERLAWVPHARLVVAVGDRVVKLHADPRETEHAVACGRAAGEVVAVPEVVSVDVARAVHVQRRVAGRGLTGADALAGVPAAAGVVRALRRTDPSRLVLYPPADLLRACAPVVRLVTFVAPELAHEVDEVVTRLARSRPAVDRLVPSHGDFNVGQLVATGDGLVVVDTDTLCSAPAAFDPASYAANLMSGRAGDLARADEVLERFAAELDADRAELDWYMAAMVVRRLDRAVRRAKRDWPERTERLVRAAEHLAGRLG